MAIEATTKAGKTLGCLYWILSESSNGGGGGKEYWWVAPIYEQAGIAFRRLKTMLTQTDSTLTVWKHNDSERFVTLANGAVIRFKSADKPDGLYGEDVYAAVIDEASRCKEEAYHAVRSTLTATNGKLRIIGNVRGRKNWAYAMARKAEAGNLPGWKYGRITAADAVKAGVITKDQVESARRELPEHIFRELYEAVPSDDGGNPFGLQHIEACVCELSSGPAVAYGVDLAKSVDWTVVIGLDENRKPCVFDRWQRVPWHDTTERILGIIGSTPALVDSTGVGDPIVEALQLRAPNVEGFQFTSKSKQQLMEGLCVAIQGHEVGILDGVMRIEHEAFEYDQTRTGVRYQAPEGMHDDCVMGLALAVERARGRTNVILQMAPVGKLEPEFSPVNFSEARKDPNWGF